MRGLAVVPPDVAVRGHAVDDGVAQLGSKQAAAHQLREVAIAQPGGEHAAVLGFGKGGADAQAGGLDAIAVEVEARQVFPIRLGQAVVAVGPARGVRIEYLVLLVEADHVVRTGEHDPLDPMAARAFVDMEDALDVRLQDFLERPLDRDTTHVHDGIAAADQPVDRRLVGQVAGLDFFMRAGCGHCGEVGQANDAGEGLEAFAQDLAQGRRLRRSAVAAPISLSVSWSPVCYRLSYNLKRIIMSPWRTCQPRRLRTIPKLWQLL